MKLPLLLIVLLPFLVACQTASVTPPKQTLGYLERDVRDDIFYFVMPDRFNNGRADNDQGSTTYPISRGGLDKTTTRGFHGGDVLGLEQKLDYLKAMGITAIWMTPILRNKAVQKDGVAHHGYWIVDFSQLDPHFGTNAELKSLIDTAHSKGMKVFFDIITNHTADVIKYEECHNSDGSFKDGLTSCKYKSLEELAAGDKYTPFIPESDRGQKYPEWLNDPQYYRNQGDSTFTGESSLRGDFSGLDDIDTEHPRVVEGMIEIYQNLIKEFRPDGYRVDTVRHVEMSFWKAFSPAIVEYAKELGIPNFHVFGEVYDPDPKELSRYTTEGKLPSVLDFGFQDAASKVFYQDKSPTHINTLFAQDSLYKDHDSDASLLMTFLGNHDMGRTGYFINQHPTAAEMTDSEKLQRSILSHAFMYFSRGIPVVYYGDEQGFTGDGNDIYAREDMFASQVDSYNDNNLIGTDATTAEENFDQSHPIYLALTDLAELRKGSVALRRGEYAPVYFEDNSSVFAFTRTHADQTVLVVMNAAANEASVELPLDAAKTTTLAGQGSSILANATLTSTLPGFSYQVIQLD